MTLTSNRDVIADILDGLAPKVAFDWPQYHRRQCLLGGAATLRWCDEHEGVGDCEGMEASLEAARATAVDAEDRASEMGETLESIKRALTAWESSTDEGRDLTLRNAICEELALATRR